MSADPIVNAAVIDGVLYYRRTTQDRSYNVYSQEARIPIYDRKVERALIKDGWTPPPVCPNCDTKLPEGCRGTLIAEPECKFVPKGE